MAHGSLYARRGAHRQLADYALDMGNTEAAMTNADWQQLEALFSQSLPHFLPRLQEFCRLSLQERRVSMLLRLGKTPTDIAQLTAHSKQSVTNTRSRLFEKTFGRKGTPADWDRLVSSL